MLQGAAELSLTSCYNSTSSGSQSGVISYTLLSKYGYNGLRKKKTTRWRQQRYQLMLTLHPTQLQSLQYISLSVNLGWLLHRVTSPVSRPPPLKKKEGLEHTAKTAADPQQACTFRAHAKGNTLLAFYKLGQSHGCSLTWLIIVRAFKLFGKQDIKWQPKLRKFENTSLNEPITQRPLLSTGHGNFSETEEPLQLNFSCFS